MFPSQAMNIPMSYEERADQMRSEFDYRAPRLRLSVFAYLVENGIEPTAEKIDEIVAYISQHTTEYAEDIATLGEGEQLDLLVLSDEDIPNNEEQGGPYL